MSGRTPLPGGNPRKASQRHSRRTAPTAVVIPPSWKAGDKVRWRDHTGHFLRNTGEDAAEVIIGARTYRVARGELRSG